MRRINPPWWRPWLKRPPGENIPETDCGRNKYIKLKMICTPNTGCPVLGVLLYSYEFKRMWTFCPYGRGRRTTAASSEQKSRTPGRKTCRGPLPFPGRRRRTGVSSERYQIGTPKAAPLSGAAFGYRSGPGRKPRPCRKDSIGGDKREMQKWVRPCEKPHIPTGRQIGQKGLFNSRLHLQGDLCVASAFSQLSQSGLHTIPQ